MKKKNDTRILEFTIIAPTCDIETTGEVLKLSPFGEFCPDNSLRAYSLLFLLDHPLHYRISKIAMKGTNFIIPEDREQNYEPLRNRETLKFFKGDKQDPIFRQLFKKFSDGK